MARKAMTLASVQHDEPVAKKRGRPAIVKSEEDEKVPAGQVRRSVMDRLERFCNAQTIPPKRTAAVEHILDRWLSENGYPDE